MKQKRAASLATDTLALVGGPRRERKPSLGPTAPVASNPAIESALVCDQTPRPTPLPSHTPVVRCPVSLKAEKSAPSPYHLLILQIRRRFWSTALSRRWPLPTKYRRRRSTRPFGSQTSPSTRALAPATTAAVAPRSALNNNNNNIATGNCSWRAAPQTTVLPTTP